MSSWKTVALVAVGFNVGVVYTTACGPFDASADDPDDLEDDIDDLEDDLDDLEKSVVCFIEHQTDTYVWDGQQLTESSQDAFEYGQGPNSDASNAYEDCF